MPSNIGWSWLDILDAHSGQLRRYTILMATVRITTSPTYNSVKASMGKALFFAALLAGQPTSLNSN